MRLHWLISVDVMGLTDHAKAVAGDASTDETEIGNI